MKICRVDANQKQIINSLRMIPSISVFPTHMVGKGFPDIVVGYKGKNYLFEIKDDAKTKSQTKLTQAEEKFHSAWSGQVDTIKTIEQILSILKIKHNA